MRVLVIIPTHDRLDFYEEAIESVMAQTRAADRLVVTGNVGPGIITDAPLAERLNVTIEAATDCDAFVMLSDDDTLHPEFLARTVAAMEREQVDIVYTDCMIFGAQNCQGYALGEWTKENIDRNTVPLVTSLCRKKAWRKVGGFANVPFFDWDYWWRCFYSGATAYWLREPLWNYRKHAGQDSLASDMAKNRLHALARFNWLRSRMEIV